MTDYYTVFGNPIAHSKSPQIHQQFALQTQQDIDYSKTNTPLDGFAETAARFFESAQGANVTVPFKQDALAWVDSLNPLAESAGAVNTILKNTDGTTTGFNTDGLGLLRDLQHNLGCSLAGRRLLLLGAGGAARGACQPLLEANPAKLLIANRTVAKAAELAGYLQKQQFSSSSVCATGFDHLRDTPFDVIINATSSSLSGDVPPIPKTVISKSTVCYDMMYADTPTPFLIWCGEQGASQLHDGWGMLVEQAAEAFSIWRGVRPDTKLLIQARL
jgi:shikimate dehydrogenase